MTQATEASMTVVQVAIDAPPPWDVVGVVRVGEREALEHAELRLNDVQPGGLGRCPDRMNPKSSQEREYAGMVVDILEVIEDHEQAFAPVTAAQAAEGALAPLKHRKNPPISLPPPPPGSR